MKTKVERAAIGRRAAKIALVNLAIGVGAMLYSLGEESVGWTFFVWLAGLEGIAIGLLAGGGYAQVVFDMVPPKWKMPPLAGFLWVVLTFWAPIIVTFLFGQMLYRTLPDAALPKSSLDGDPNGAGYMQSLVTLFNAIGCVWLMVFLVSKKIDKTADDSATETVDGANA